MRVFTYGQTCVNDRPAGGLHGIAGPDPDGRGDIVRVEGRRRQRAALIDADNGLRR